MEKESPSLAMLVDGDNVSHKAIKGHNRRGVQAREPQDTARVRRLDQAKPDKLEGGANLNALLQIQQSNYTSDKNSTDGALIIDAMDMLYTDDLDGFCIVSSDSDYTRLAIKLRESGKRVLGIGNKATPPSLVNACNVFTHIETITGINEHPSAEAAPGQSSGHDFDLAEQVTRAIEESSGRTNGCCFLS